MLVAQNLTKYYGAFRALHNISFTIEMGETVGLLGLNGAGKSTLLNILAGNTVPASGSVTLGGKDLFENHHQLANSIGFLADPPPIYSDMSVSEFLKFVLKIKGSPTKNKASWLAATLEQTGLENQSHQLISTLSHGYKQRVGIAQAIVHQPKYIFLDEPFQGLDPLQIVEMRQCIHSLKKHHTVLLSSHRLNEIHQTCDNVIVIHEGTLKAQGPEATLTKRIRNSHILHLEVRGNSQAVKAFFRNYSEPLTIKSCLPSGNVSKPKSELGAASASDMQIIVLETSELIAEPLSKDLIEAGFGLHSLFYKSNDLEKAFVALAESNQDSNENDAGRHE